MAQGGLICAYLLDGRGGGHPVSWDEIKAWQPEQGLLWVHLNFTRQQTKKWLKQHPSVSQVARKILVADESRPRTVVWHDAFVINLRGINHNPGNEPDDMVSIRLWCNANTIITTRRRKLFSIEDMKQAIEEGRGPKTPGEFIVSLADYLTNRLSVALESVSDKLDNFDEQLSEKTALVRGQLSEIRREIVSYRRYLFPQRDALNRLAVEKMPWISEEERSLLRETTERVTRYVEDMDSARDRAAVTYEELLGQISARMEQRMYVLSVIAAIFLPLSFITGLLGINVAGIPGSDYPFAFLIVTGLAGVIVGLEIWLLKKLGWV